MTTAAASKSTYRSDDLVTRNEILKAQVFLEEKARREWMPKWGFLLDFDKILLEEAKKRGFTEERYRSIVEFRKDKRKIAEDYIWTPNPVPVPRTSSGVVGWRRYPDHSLEKLGPMHVNPLYTLPLEEPTYNIFLG